MGKEVSALPRPPGNLRLFVFIKVYTVELIFIQKEVHKGALPSDPKLRLCRDGCPFSCGITGSENKLTNLKALL